MTDKFQIVGSLLRPEELLKYKTQIEHNDDIQYPFYENYEGYEKCETEAIKQVVAKEIEHNLSVVTDGEFSKSMWHLDFVWGFGGVKRYIADHGYFFRDVDGTSKYETRKDIGLRITDKLSGKIIISFNCSNNCKTRRVTSKRNFAYHRHPIFSVNSPGQITLGVQIPFIRTNRSSKRA